MRTTQMLLLKVNVSQKKTLYNIAARCGLKISIHTTETTAQVLILLDKDILTCNLLTLPASARAFYWFFDELRTRDVEYSLDVFTHDYRETKKLQAKGVFDTKQRSLSPTTPIP